MSMPEYVSLQNKSNGEYRNNHATQMQSNYQSPQCLFRLELQSGGNNYYGIKNCQNKEYFQCNITSMSPSIEGSCQLWTFEPVANVLNGYYIKNVKNGQYMCNHATQLSKNPGENEVYIIVSQESKQLHSSAVKMLMPGMGSQYDSAKSNPTIALNSANTVLSFSRNSSNELYYYVGNIDNAVINWGNATPYMQGGDPAVAMNDKGVFVEVHAQSPTPQSQLFWYSGSVNMQNRTITHGAGVAEDFSYTGAPPSVALNNNGDIAAALSNGTSVICKVGKANNNSLSFLGQNTFAGTQPAIAFSGNNQLIIVYINAAMNLCYRLGSLQNNTITWQDEMPVGSPQLGASQINTSVAPSVVYTNSQIIVAYQTASGNNLNYLVGSYDTQNNKLLWSDAALYDSGSNPCISSNGTYLVQCDAYSGGVYYTVCLITNHATWMGDLFNTIQDKTLGQIVMPASHDAGMYESGILPEARTQDLSILGQLLGGVRYFDLRPKYDSSTQSFNMYHGPSTGESLTDVLNDVQTFMKVEQKMELVILKFSHFSNFGSDSANNSVYRNFINQVYDALQDYLCTQSASTQFGSLTLSQILNGSGKVLVVCDDSYAINNPQTGIFTYRDGSVACPQENRSTNPAQGNLVVYDCYSNTTNYSTMVSDQMNKFNAYNGYCDGNYTNIPCNMFLLSWTLTPAIQSVWSCSVEPARTLGAQMNNLQPNQYGKIPNLLYVNYYEYTRCTDIAIQMNKRLA